ncbi:hypothetical protein ACH5RR_028689 [Cinchona calisaya]|uniref:Uncharacterized protein n=1 Tax=Cinchona calisaya TaxID=153742 RepID=A0ABD2YQQ8_9GENT
MVIDRSVDDGQGMELWDDGVLWDKMLRLELGGHCWNELALDLNQDKSCATLWHALVDQAQAEWSSGLRMWAGFAVATPT